MTQVRSLGREDPLEKGLAYILSWEIPQTEEHGIQSIASPRVGHD